VSGTIKSCRLPPLRWIAEEPVVYDEAENELHRPQCSQAPDEIELASGEALELVWARGDCAACRADVTLGLGR
jgi:hypothetical protein